MTGLVSIPARSTLPRLTGRIIYPIAMWDRISVQPDFRLGNPKFTYYEVCVCIILLSDDRTVPTPGPRAIPPGRLNGSLLTPLKTTFRKQRTYRRISIWHVCVCVGGGSHKERKK